MKLSVRARKLKLQHRMLKDRGLGKVAEEKNQPDLRDGYFLFFLLDVETG